jgi:signal transduction histidine kinase
VASAWLAFRRCLIAVVCCLRDAGLAVLAAPLFAFALLVGALTGPVLGPLLATTTRWHPTVIRHLTRIESPYPPHPEGNYRARVRWFWTDPATWRDFTWLLAEPVVGLALLLPGVLALYGWVGLVLPGAEQWTAFFYGTNAPSFRITAVLVGVALMIIGFALAPHGLRWHASWCRLMLAPTNAARLTQRVAQLTATRTDATDAQASELRRIERDLHDGAQARLAAVTITLGAAEQLLKADPDAARDLYTKARQSVHTALTELRDLVNGIHPPVLAERGLADAIRALVLDAAMHVTVTADLPGRLPEPVESAAYFAVSELLANVAKHTGDTAAEVTLEYAPGVLRIQVTDQGPGGADVSNGSGLRGITRRVAVFDGSLTLASPVGGPTVATLEIPCALSSPKTTNSSETR